MLASSREVEPAAAKTLAASGGNRRVDRELLYLEDVYLGLELRQGVVDLPQPLFDGAKRVAKVPRFTWPSRKRASTPFIPSRSVRFASRRRCLSPMSGAPILTDPSSNAHPGRPVTRR